MLKSLCRTLAFGYLLIPAVGIAGPPLGDGSSVDLGVPGASIVPPIGWEIIAGEQGKSLILQEPKSDKVVYDVATYQRNLTVAISHGGQVSDEQTVQELRQKITESFSRYGQDFRLADQTEFFDYKGSKDGILIYSFMTLNKVPVSQAHAFVSGKEHSLLMTYTDMSSRFEQDRATFEMIWQSMVSAQLEGVPAQRYEQFILPGAIGGSIFLLFFLFALIRQIAGRRRYLEDEDFYEGDDSERSYRDENPEFASLPETSLTAW